MARLSRVSTSITQNIFIDKVGVQKLLTALNVAVTKIQQAAITIIAVIIVSDATREKRIIQDKVCELVRFEILKMSCDLYLLDSSRL